MSLLVTIIKSPDSVNITESTKTFGEQGGSIGRGKENAWVLDDPERFLSSCHCQISSENGQFYITDLSTNGTFFNDAAHPMGKGTRLALDDDSVFVLGDYKFSVSNSTTAQGVGLDSISADMPPPGNDFGLSDANPFGGGHVSSSDSLFSTGMGETDPLAALDKAQSGSSAGIPNDFSQPPPSVSDPFAGGSHSDRANPLNEQVSWPDSAPEQSGGIPDDWDDDSLSNTPLAPVPKSKSVPKPSMPLTEPPVMPTPGPAPQAVVSQNTGNQLTSNDSQALLAQQKENKKLRTELKILKQQIEAQQNSTQAEVSVDTALIETLGLPRKNLVDEEINQINKLAGEVLREMVSGLMQVLGSRSSIKNEFRMNVTTIQPVENNPLKFSANVDDALENMFIKQGNAYKKPVAAVREGFEGVAEHQIAILAGIRAAFKSVLERFDPIILEQRFAKQKKGSIIPSSQKAKNWECYLDYYEELAGDIDNSFQYLFGDEFVKAYEDQLQKLVISRKTHNTKSD